MSDRATQRRAAWETAIGLVAVGVAAFVHAGVLIFRGLRVRR